MYPPDKIERLSQLEDRLCSAADEMTEVLPELIALWNSLKIDAAGDKAIAGLGAIRRLMMAIRREALALHDGKQP